MFHCKITTLIRDLKGLGLLTKRIEIVILILKCKRRREKKQSLNNPQKTMGKIFLQFKPNCYSALKTEKSIYGKTVALK